MNVYRDLSKKTESEIRAELDRRVARLNRRIRLGAVSEWQVAELLELEHECRLLGNEIRRRYGRSLLS